MNGEPNEGPFVDMAVRRIVLRDQHDSQMIYLCEAGGPRSFAISIGRTEAEEMRRVVAQEQTARPLTHQLLLDTVRAAGGTLARIEIHDLRHNTFHARLVVQVDSGQRSVDARSSDAIALALRAGCPIQVAESVLQQVRIDLGPDTLPAPKSPGAPDESTEDDEDEEDDDEDDEDSGDDDSEDREDP